MRTLNLALVPAGTGVLLLTWLVAAMEYPTLAPRIPIHFNFKGEADNFGSAWNIFVPAGISTVLTIGLLLLSRSPHIYNYPVKITGANREAQYRLASLLLLRIMVLIGLMFLLVTLSMSASAKGSDYLPPWSIFFPLGGLFLLVFRHLWQAGKVG